MLCTIHQPSSEVFFLFDLVIFIKDGKIFYQGPVRACVEYFDYFAYKCPLNYNPADYVMMLAQTISAEECTAKQLYMTGSEHLQLLKSGLATTEGELSQKELQDDALSSMRLDGEVNFAVERSFGTQLITLLHRECVNAVRDRGALIGRFGSNMFLHLLFGLIFYKTGSKDFGNDTDFFSHQGRGDST